MSASNHPLCIILRPSPDETFAEHESAPLLGNLIAGDGTSLPTEALRWKVDGIDLPQTGRFALIEKRPVGRVCIELSCATSPESVARVYVDIRTMSDTERLWLRRCAEVLGPPTEADSVERPERQTIAE